MMIRKEIADSIEKEIKACVEKRLQLLSGYTKEDKQMLKEKLKTSCNTVFKQAIKQQEEGKKEAIGVIAFSFLRSFIQHQRYEIRIDVYNKDYFLDEKECSAYWDVGELFEQLDEDIDYLIQCTKQKIIRLKTYEINWIKQQYRLTYMQWLAAYLGMNYPTILEGDTYNSLKKEDELMIVFGEYLSDTIPIYQA